MCRLSVNGANDGGRAERSTVNHSLVLCESHHIVAHVCEFLEFGWQDTKRAAVRSVAHHREEDFQRLESLLPLEDFRDVIAGLFEDDMKRFKKLSEEVQKKVLSIVAPLGEKPLDEHVAADEFAGVDTPPAPNLPIGPYLKAWRDVEGAEDPRAESIIYSRFTPL